MSLFNSDSNMTGIYRAYLTKPDSKSNKKRIYIPAIHTINPYELEGEEFEKALQLLPEVRWCLPEQETEDEPIWISFESGNIKYPVIIGFFRDVIKSEVSYQSSGSGGDGGSGQSNTGDNYAGPGGEMSDNPPSSSGWIWPTSIKIQTSAYGPRNVTVGSKNHAGIDIGTPSNTPVFAAKDGVVKKAQWNDGYGNNIDILHDDGKLLSRYAHLNSFNVNVGDNVVRGQQIALSGNTGVGTGPHLHFEIRDPNIGGSYGYNGSYNPRNYVNP